MHDPLAVMLRHGRLTLFLSVFFEEAGVPFPAVPFILAGGALVAQGIMGAGSLLLIGLAASVLGDLIWYGMGRARGNAILKLLCRISIEPDSCVGTAKGVFQRYRSRGLILAKFVPALGSVMPPLAGMAGIGLAEFLVFDGIGALLYVGAYGALGALFSNKLAQLIEMLAGLGSTSALILAGSFAAYLLWKWIRRRQFLNKLKTARITVDELQELQESGKDVLIFDLRPAVDLEAKPYLVPAARWIAREELTQRHQEIPRDREIVLYCSCPNEATAAQIALILQKHGIHRVRPLLGGIDAWMERGYATVAAPARGQPSEVLPPSA
jgi:membrane protein DedA with SNARE-associated domain/rhodanese-related sulfurtransferase